MIGGRRGGNAGKRPRKKRSTAAARTRTDPARTRVLAGGRRGRPTQDEVQSINTAIIQTAHKMFLHVGYKSAPMESIAEQAGVSKKTLYARFPTKSELFTAVVNHQVAAWSAHAGRYDSTMPAALAQRLEHHALMFLEAQATPEAQGFERLLLTEARNFPELARIYQETATGFVLDLIARELATAAAQERRPIRDARAAAQMFVDTVTSWVTLNSMLGIVTTEAERQRVAKYRVAVFLDGRAAW